MRRRYLYTMNGVPLPEPIEVTAVEREPEVRTQVLTDRWMEGTKAPDGTDIGARWKREQYMKQNGLADAGDYKGVWAKAEKERQEYRAGRAPPSKELREEIGRINYELQSRRKR